MRGKNCCSRCGAAEGIDKVGKVIRRSEPIQVALPKLAEFIWPPIFESNGSSYVFDPRSNMFYEPNSDFFFDCNTKLYYSNKRKAYYSLLEGETGAVFQKLSSTISTTNQSISPPSSSSILPAADPQEPAVVDTKKKGIAIHIRSKSLSRPRERSKSHGRRSMSRLQADIDVPRDPRQKEQIQNVEKWNNQLSLKSTIEASREVALSVASILPHPNTTSAMTNYANLQSVLGIAKATCSDLSIENPVSTSGASPSIITTRTGQPICVLCKRKFASLDQLRRHEEESELHKTNVAKRKAEELSSLLPIQPPTTIPTVQYEDRAKKRRHLHADVPMVHRSRPEEVRDPVVGAAVIDPESALNHDNVGNQLFQRMLVKSGTLDDPNKLASGGLNDSIKEEWRRIESMSQPRALRRELADEKVKGVGFV